MNSDQKKELESFLKRTEGKSPLVFVGRSEVLDDLTLAAEQVWEFTDTDGYGMEKATRIIQGAPGAGKSSIVHEIRHNPETITIPYLTQHHPLPSSREASSRL